MKVNSKFKKILLSMGLLISLTGCVKADVNFNVKSETDVELNTKILLSKQVFGTKLYKEKENLKKDFDKEIEGVKYSDISETIDGKEWDGVSITGKIAKDKVSDFVSTEEKDGKKYLIFTYNTNNDFTSKLNNDAITESTDNSSNNTDEENNTTNIPINIGDIELGEGVTLDTEDIANNDTSNNNEDFDSAFSVDSEDTNSENNDANHDDEIALIDSYNNTDDSSFSDSLNSENINNLLNASGMKMTLTITMPNKPSCKYGTIKGNTVTIDTLNDSLKDVKEIVVTSEMDEDEILGGIVSSDGMTQSQMLILIVCGGLLVVVIGGGIILYLKNRNKGNNQKNNQQSNVPNTTVPKVSDFNSQNNKVIRHTYNNANNNPIIDRPSNVNRQKQKDRSRLCPQCGSKLDDDSDKCKVCGYKIWK